jgi:Translation initiation factor eIF3 subunit
VLVVRKDQRGVIGETFSCVWFFVLVPSTSIRKIKNSVDNIYLEKQKLEKGDKPKKSKAGKKGVKLRVEGQNVSV